VLTGKARRFSSLSESGFIPTKENGIGGGAAAWYSSHLFQRVASFLHGKWTIEDEI